MKKSDVIIPEGEAESSSGEDEDDDDDDDESDDEDGNVMDGEGGEAGEIADNGQEEGADAIAEEPELEDQDHEEPPEVCNYFLSFRIALMKKIATE